MGLLSRSEARSQVSMLAYWEQGLSSERSDPLLLRVPVLGLVSPRRQGQWDWESKYGSRPQTPSNSPPEFLPAIECLKGQLHMSLSEMEASADLFLVPGLKFGWGVEEECVPGCASHLTLPEISGGMGRKQRGRISVAKSGSALYTKRKPEHRKGRSWYQTEGAEREPLLPIHHLAHILETSPIISLKYGGKPK